MDPKEKKELTLMFFFASDNSLSPSMLYQLKSIKAAGHQENTNVLVHFDPHERGIPSFIFEINKMDKEGQGGSRHDDYPDLTLRGLAGDQVEPEINDQRKEPGDSDSLPAAKALEHFLEFGRKFYPAKKYMLFLVGHGLVVGLDAFLPDSNPVSGISLVNLGTILRDFTDAIKKNQEKLELIGMHSCSMSAVEVAYQLKGYANYMMASEGLSFVGAWPYRQMLEEIFAKVDKENGADFDFRDLVKSLHERCVQNSTDFIFAGYSSDLCLISLDPERIKALRAPIETLTKALRAGLNDDRGKELILLAHWKSQSYFQELYTDLKDFCLCLKESCSESDTNQVQKSMRLACESVMKVLTPATDTESAGPIVQADFYGADCQYSYGLSIYFPWAKPIEDANENIIKNYRTYDFVTDLGGASWLQFLEEYFEKTIRAEREINADSTSGYKEKVRILRMNYKPIGYPSSAPAFETSALNRGKVSPADASGYFTYSVIKNYPRDYSITERASRVFTNEKERGKKQN